MTDHQNSGTDSERNGQFSGGKRQATGTPFATGGTTRRCIVAVSISLVYLAPVLTHASGPSQPTNLTATVTACASVSLTWAPSTGGNGSSALAGYKIFRNGVPYFTNSALVTTFVDTSLIRTTNYSYTVSAYDGRQNESAQSSPAQVFPCSDRTAPLAPASLSANVVSSSQVNVGWSRSSDPVGQIFELVSGVKSYQLYRNGTNSNNKIAEVGDPSVAYSDTAAPPNSSVFYAMRAMDNGSNFSAFVFSATVTTPPLTDTTAPTVPSALAVSGVTCASVQLGWQASSDPTITGQSTSGVKGYNIYRGGVYVGFTASTSYSDAGLTGNTTYSYQVSAVDNANNASGLSGAVSTSTAACTDTTPPTMPGGLTVTAVDCTSLQVTWQPSVDPTNGNQAASGIYGYRIYRGGYLYRFVTTTSLLDSGLSSGTSYGYQVSALDNALNESVISSLMVGTTPGCSPVARAATDLHLGIPNPGQVTLNWSGTPGALYQVQCALGFGSPWEPLDAPTLNFGVSAFAQSPQSIYRVALFTNTPAYLSNFVTNSADKEPPSSPGNLNVTPLADDSVTISWDPSTDFGTTDGTGQTFTSGLDAYFIYRDGVFLKTEPAPVSSTTDAPTPFDVTLNYSVGAIDKAGNLSKLTTNSIVMRQSGPGAPTGLTGSATLCNQVNLSWTPPTKTGSGLAHYNIYRSGTLIQSVTTPNWTDGSVAAATAYSYAVSAVDNSNKESAKSTAITVTTPACTDTSPPTIPTGLTGGAAICNQAAISWNASTDSGGSGLQGYKVYRNGAYLMMVLAPTTSATDNSVAGNTVYWYAVSAVDNANNESSQSGSFTIVTPACAGNPPTVPTGLTGSAASCTNANLSWKPSTDQSGTGLNGYKIYRNGTLVLQVSAATTNAVDNGLSPSTSYSYSVSAVDNQAQESAQSGTISVVTPACGDSTPPSVPTNLAASGTTCTNTTLKWHASTDTGGSGLKGYNVYRNGAFLVQVLAPSTNLTDNTLSGSTTYSYTVSAVDNANNQSAQSSSVNVTTSACSDTTAPSVPSGLAVSSTTCSNATLRWNASTDTGGSGLKGYNLYRNGTFIVQVLAPATTVTDNGLSASTTYSYTVAAVDNAANTSAQSASVNATTTACPDTTAPSVPTGLTVTGTTCSNATVHWNASTDTGGSGLKGYNLYRNGIFIVQVLAPTTSGTDNGLNASTTYSYTVSAVDNAANASAQSASVNATTTACGDATPPSVPTGLTGSAANCTNVSLHWNASTDTGGSGLKGYNVYRNGAFIVQVLAPATNLTDTGLSGSTTYGYMVSAVDNANNQSAQTATFNVSTPACPCSYQASPTSISYSSSGGSGTITVTASPNCVWTSTSNVPWITITSGTRGTNNGTVGYSVNPNSGPSSLTGTMTIAGQTITVTESGTGGADSTAPSISISTPNSGATVSGAVVVNANASDNVGVTSVQFYVDNLGSWVLIGTQSGVGPGPANYALNYNTTNVANGAHNFLCRAYDAAGNSSYTINAVTVTNYNADPGVLSWAKDAGVSPLTGEAQHTSVKADSHGNQIVVGKFQGTINYAGTSMTSAGGYDFFIAKFGPDGSLTWVRSYGGAYDNIASSVAVDSNDNIIITGQFVGSMNLGGGVLTSEGGNNYPDLFVAKFSSSGAHVWSKVFGGSYGNYGNGVAVDRNNDVYVTGDYNFQANFGGGTIQSQGGGDGFLVKFAGSTGGYIWATSFGGSAYDDSEALAIDGNGDVLVSGFTTGNMDFGHGSLPNAGGSDAFLAKFSGSTGGNVWAQLIGGAGNEDGSGLSVDIAGDGYLVGSFSSSLTIGTVTLSAPLSTAMFIAKYDPSGGLVWAKSFGGQSSIGGNVSPRAATVDANGNVIATGTVTGEADFGNGQITAGTGDIFIAKYGAGGGYLWSKRYGTGGSSSGSGVTTDQSRNVICTGSYAGSVNFDGVPLSTLSGQTKDAYLLKYSP